MGAPYCRSRIVFPLVALLLVDLVFLRPSVAAEARSDTHAEGKSSTSGKASGARAPSGSESGRAGAARHDTPSSHGEAGKGQQSIHSGGNQAGKNVGAPTPGGADSGIDTSIAPSRTSDRGQRSGQEKPVANSFAGRNTHRGVLPLPLRPIVRCAMPSAFRFRRSKIRRRVTVHIRRLLARRAKRQA
jgi:hypothetical protein